MITRKKALSTIISVIILIVVAVIITTLILSWGKDFTTKGTEKTQIIFQETNDYLISNTKIQGTVLSFKNISPKKTITITGYKILSTSDDSNFNTEILLENSIEIASGATGILPLNKLPPENKITIEILTSDNTKITLTNILNNNSNVEEEIIGGGGEEEPPIILSSEKNILYFTLLDTNGTIDPNNNTITFSYPYGTNVTNLIPTITISEEAIINPESGSAQNFTTTVTYTVTAEDGSTKNYTVTINVAPVHEGIGLTPTSGQIWYLEHLDYIDTNSTTLAGTYTLMRDLNFSEDSSYYNTENKTTWTTGSGWMPLGTSATKFTGTFNGNSKKISNLFINRSSTDYQGLFGYTDGSSVNISNLNLLNANITGRDYVAGIIGYQNYGTLTNNSVNATITGRNNIGIITGLQNYGTITKCYSLGTINATNNLGGIVGRMSGTSTVSDSYSFAKIFGDSAIGGLVGYMTGPTPGSNARILQSYSTGYIRGAYHGDNGGLVGSLGSYTQITDSYWDIDTSTRLTSAAGTGKTTTEMKTQTTFNTWNFTTTWAISEGSSYPYLITNTQSPAPTPIHPPEPTLIYNAEDLYNIRNDISRNAYYKLANDIDLNISPYNTGEGWLPIGSENNQFNAILDGNGYKIINLFINRPLTDYQSLFGYVNKFGYIVNLELINANITGRDYTSGFVAKIDKGYLFNNYITGNITGRDYVGGLIGHQDNGTISNSRSNIFITARKYVGGITGQQDYETITKCYSLGTITASNSLGGIVGRMSGTSTVSNSYSLTEIMGETYSGGLVGYMAGPTPGSNARILRSYSKGQVSGTTNLGGLVGGVGSYTSFTNSFWDMNTSGRTTSAGGTGKTTAEMKTQSTFTDWNFTTIWNMTENTTYPYLRDNTQSPLPQ